MIRIGFACKLLAVPNTQMISCTLKNAVHERLIDVGKHNLLALIQSVEYCQKMGIALFRISSDILPFASHPDVQFDWKKLLEKEITLAGQAIKQANIRVSMHPGQYTVLNSPHAMVVERAVSDLVYHAGFLDALGLDTNHKLILHVGGLYNNRSEALERFAAHFALLPENVRNRLTLENDDRSFAIDDVLYLCHKLHIPAVFDVLHHEVLPASGKTSLEWLDLCSITWENKDGPQKIHYSEQKQDGKPGAHSATIRVKTFCAFYQSIAHKTLDIMLEVKDKNISAVKCVHLMHDPLPAKYLQESWAHYKYKVLEHSHSSYLTARRMVSSSTPLPSALEFYTLCDDVLDIPLTSQAAQNAAQHVWGYFKKNATVKEKIQYGILLLRLSQDVASLPKVKKFFYSLAEKYQQSYLLKSYYFI